MKLGQWIAQYYLAPIGDVFRGMLPLAAEIKKAKLYRITEVGYEALHASATAGSSRRSKQDIDTQMVEYAVLDYLSMSDEALEGTIRSLPARTAKFWTSCCARNGLRGRMCLLSATRNALCRWPC